MTIRGSCLCGEVRYEIDGEMGRMGHCHCSMCRKAHGAAFGTYGVVDKDRFRFVAGEDLVTSYASSPDVNRTFCSRCGATLQFITRDAGHLGVAVGTLDDDPGIRPSYHIWTDSKAPWWAIDDDLWSHPTEPD
ncbi:MAG: GFA family protein [Gammaproteobacteria bacterium]|jgi:hypothetical protein